MSGLYKQAPSYDTKIVLHRGVLGEIVLWSVDSGVGQIAVGELPDKIEFKLADVVAYEQYPPILNEKVQVFAKYDDVNRVWLASKITSEERDDFVAAQNRQPERLGWWAKLRGLFLSRKN